MSNRGQRASREDIFTHLHRFLGQGAVQAAQQVAALANSTQNEQALEALQTYDQELGGVGLHWFQDKRLLGVYRPLFYVLLPIKTSSAPQEYSRQIVYHACAYLEELIKRMIRLNLFERILDGTASRLPLGTLVRKLRYKIPDALYNDLDWLAQNVYNFAKHKFNFEEEITQPEYYFSLDEAIAVYLIARKLGLDLERFVNQTPEQLMEE